MNSTRAVRLSAASFARLSLLAGVILPIATLSGASEERLQSPRIIRTVEPRYPEVLKANTIFDGQAKLILLVDAEGRLADALATYFTNEAFAREALDVVKKWRYEPARRDGRPVDVRFEVVFDYHAGGGVVAVTPNDQVLRYQLQGDPGTSLVCAPNELDRPLEPKSTVHPVTPTGWKGKEGRVVLDFYVDQQGRPRMPAATEATDEALVPAALAALSHWEFTPPTRRGEPVMARAQQSFRFTRP